jgi:hypothetical protein
MKEYALLFVWIIMAWLLAAATDPGILMADDNTKSNSGSPSGSLQQRIDFGNAHIMGQSIKSGAVYLMHRKKSDINSMLKVRQNYRVEIKEEYGLENTALDTDKRLDDQTR